MTRKRRWLTVLALAPFALIVAVVALRWYAADRLQAEVGALEARGKPTELAQLGPLDSGDTTANQVVMGLWGPGFRDRIERLKEVLPSGQLGSSEFTFDPNVHRGISVFGTHLEGYLEHLSELEEWSDADSELAEGIVGQLGPEIAHLRGLATCRSLGWGPMDGCGSANVSRGIAWPYFHNAMLWLETAMKVHADRGEFETSLKLAALLVELQLRLEESSCPFVQLVRAPGWQRLFARITWLLDVAPERLDVSELERLVRASSPTFDRERWFDAVRVDVLTSLSPDRSHDTMLYRAPLIGSALLNAHAGRWLAISGEIEEIVLRDPNKAMQRLSPSSEPLAGVFSAERKWHILLRGLVKCDQPDYEAARRMMLETLNAYQVEQR